MKRLDRRAAMNSDGFVTSLGGRDEIRLVLSLVPAVGINLLLMWLILRLVDPTRSPPREANIPRPVEWVSVQPVAEKAPEPSTAMPMAESQSEPPLPAPELPDTPGRVSAGAPPLSRPRIDLELRPLGRLTPTPSPASDIARPSAPALDVEPSAQVAPVYPPRARRAGIEGSVTVEFTITPQGGVTGLEVVASQPRGVFDASVTKAIRQWRFTPRVVDGQRVERRARKEIVFSLEDR
ncbi:MAG: TonB family protein [Gammaproteobacteria bacterium]|jgi:protein TonB|nr:TonB family protein [Gammaproteobacteria bacterium]